MGDVPKLDRLTPLDAGFLHFEHPHTPLHVGGLFVFRTTPEVAGRPGLDGLFRTVAERIHEVPRYRQRAVEVPLGLGQPVWADDPEFDLSYHLRRAAVPSPGTTRELIEQVARLHARPLDRRRPLWECYVIEGLEGGRVALYTKIHHAMIDGLAGIDLATILLDLSPAGRPPEEPRRWQPRALPSPWELVGGAAMGGLDSLAGVAALARRPARVAAELGVAAAGAAGLGRLVNLLRPAPQSPINQPVGAARRISLAAVPLARAKLVKNALHTTVNDVVLAAVGEAFDHFLEHRAIAHAEQLYRVMVPVSVRDESERNALGNRVTAMFVDLPVGPMPARRRLAAVSRAMRDLKEHRQAIAADRLITLAGLAPATLHGLAGRLEFTNQRLINTVVSNVPGPQFPLYSGGSLLLEWYPLLPLVANMGVIVCVTSYDGELYFGIVGDRELLPDIDVLGDGLRRGFDRLELAALEASRGREAVLRLGTPRDELVVQAAGKARRARSAARPAGRGSRRRVAEPHGEAEAGGAT